MIGRVTIGIVAALLATSCGRDAMLRCEDPETYQSAAEQPPIRVPDDLSVPDQSDALQIPPEDRVADAADPVTPGPCLESPPIFQESAADGATPATPAP